MYIPTHFLETDKQRTLAFMRKYSFATIVTSKNNIPTASHLPFVIVESEDEIILISHFAKANPQWMEISDHQSLIIFSEPHAYISPSYYEKEQNVPTWNYVAIHAYGNGTIISDKDRAFTILETIIDTFEPNYKSQWKKLSDDYKHKMLNGIVAFEFRVTDIQAKRKLSQNRTETEQQSIINGFLKSNNQNEREIGALMKQSKQI